MKITDPDHLLYIEPHTAATEPLIDDITRKVTAAWRVRRTSDCNSRGWHNCTGDNHRCRSPSDNCDHWVAGYKTHSLLIHYVACHRSEVPFGTLALIESWSPMAEPTAAELGYQGSDSLRMSPGQTEGMDEAVARQRAAKALVPADKLVTMEKREVAGHKWHQARFEAYSTGWCMSWSSAHDRLQAWFRGDVITEMPQGQCTLSEMAWFAGAAAMKGSSRNELRGATRAALEHGAGSDKWLAVSPLIWTDPELLNVLNEECLPSRMLRRPDAL